MNPAAQAGLLIRQGRADAALALLQPLAVASNPPHGVLAAQASALKVLGRLEEALAVQRRTVELYPASAVAWHNLAADLADLRKGAPARAAAERALELGLDAPQAWFVLGNACALLADVEEAERAYREAVTRRPDYCQAVFALTRLVWMRTGDADAAIAWAKALRQSGHIEPMLILIEAKVLEAADRPAEARMLLREVLSRRPRDPNFLLALAQVLLEGGECDEAAELMEKGLAIMPQSVDFLVGLASARLGQGMAQEALTLARRATDLAPLDQSTWGWLATTARAADDPAYQHLYDYPAFVRPYRIEAPSGWPSLHAYLADLAATLRRMHVLNFAPSDQSLRQGVQTPGDLADSEEPAIRAFFQVIEAPIRRYLAEVGEGPDPLRSRNTGDYLVSSAWSVWLKPSGFHFDHIHREGWLSSAFYVETPAAALETERREGWIKFGQAPLPIIPHQPPEHFVKPEPGLLVLFPSYMWHGTVPFTSQEQRLSIAFDLLPK